MFTWAVSMHNWKVCSKCYLFMSVFLTVLKKEWDQKAFVGPKLRMRIWEFGVSQLFRVLLLNRFNLQNNFWGCSDLDQTLSYRDIFFSPNSVLYNSALLPKCFFSFGVLININILLEKCNLLGCSIDCNTIKKYFTNGRILHSQKPPNWN